MSSRRKFYEKGIQRQCLLSFMTLVLLTGIVVAGVSYWINLSNTEITMKKDVTQQTSLMNDSFRTLFTSIEHNADTVAEEDKWPDGLEDGRCFAFIRYILNEQ